MENLQPRLLDYPATETSEIRKYIESKNLSNFLKFSQEYDQLSVFGDTNELIAIVAHNQKLYVKKIDRGTSESQVIIDFFEMITEQEFKGKDILKTDI